MIFILESLDGIDIAGQYDQNISLIIDRKLNIADDNRSFVGDKLKKIYTNSTFGEDQAALVKVRSSINFCFNRIFRFSINFM